MRAVGLSLVALLLCGCGSDGVTRYQYSGKVTFMNQPVPAGQVVFTPDASAGNKGAPGYATIKNGVYDTKLGGMGPVGGPHEVRIEGYEPGSGQGDEAGKTLFREYTIKVDLPKKNDAKDFDVPAAAATAPSTTVYSGP